MTQIDSGDDEETLPVTADFVLRPSRGEPQNPNSNKIVGSDGSPIAVVPSLLLEVPISSNEAQIQHSSASHSTRSSRAIERIRAVKAAYKSQLNVASSQGPTPDALDNIEQDQNYGETEGATSRMYASGPEDVEISFTRGKGVSLLAKEELAAKLYEKLQKTANAIQELKECTLSVISAKDEHLKRLKALAGDNKIDFGKEGCEEEGAQFSKTICMSNIFDQVIEVLGEDESFPQPSPSFLDGELGANSGHSKTSPCDLIERLPSRDNENEIGECRSRPRRSSWSESCSRSISPEARARRRDSQTKFDLPAPGGGFRRLADMSSNAFLANASGLRPSIDKKLTIDNNADNQNSFQLKHPMKVLMGQTSLVSEQEFEKKSNLKTRRRASVSVQIEAGSEKIRKPSLDDGNHSSVAASSSAKKKKGFNSMPGSWFRNIWLAPKGCLSKIVNNKNMDDEEMTIGPYIRFLWILSLGFLDFFLVLVLLFWPETDFMCKAQGLGSNSRVIEEDDIIATIVAILCLHFGDVVSRMRSRDPTGRRIGLRFFSPQAVGGKGVALFNAWDCFIISVSAVVVWANNYLCNQYLADDTNSWAYRVIKRLHIIVHIVRCIVGIQKCIRLGKHFRRRLQRAVSMNKRRFVDPENRFDLDLTYICDRLIAMAIPCVDGALYRNDIREVARFFATRHYGRFLVFNLCEDFETNGNGCYDCMLLYDQVQKLPFRDHNVPPLHVLVGFCKQATAWLNEHPANIVTIHCQGGKGRSGTFCSSLMMWTRFAKCAADVLEAFQQRRTDPRIDSHSIQGVAAPCQIRYVHYVEEIVLRKHDFISPTRILITSVSLHTMPFYRKKNIRVSFIIECFGTVQYDYGKRHGLAILSRSANESPEQDEFKFEIEDTFVAGDVTIRFFVFEEYSLGPFPHADVGPGARTVKYGNVTGKQLCFVTFHTNFHDENLVFTKSEIDGAYDKSNLDFLDSFSMSVTFQRSNCSGRIRRFHRSGSVCVTRQALAPPKEPLLKTQGSKIKMDPSQQDIQTRWKNIPYGHATGPRLIRLYEAVEDIMMYACPEVFTFERAELMYDPEEEEFQRSLYFIVSGVAEYCWLYDEEHHKPSRINRGDSIAGLQIGAGEFYGELKFLLGNDGDPSSFCLRAASDVVQVRVLRLGSDCGCSGIVPTSCSRYLPEQLPIIFEVLAKSLSAKARDVALHIQRLSIKPSSVKRDAHVGAREAQIIQKVIKELQILPTDHYIKMVTATLISNNGSETNGYLVLFSNALVFYSARRFARRSKNLKLFFKDIPQATSFGEKLTIFVGIDKLEGQNANLGKQSGKDRSTSPERRGQNSHSPTRKGIMSASSSPSGGFSAFNYKNIFSRRHKSNNILGKIATVVSSSSDEKQAQLCIHFSLSDNETCSMMKNLISGRIYETQMASISYQKEAYKTSEKLRGNELMFGYLLPDETVSEEEREAVHQIFSQAKSCTYKPGDEILARGCIDRSLYHILSGNTVCLSLSGQVLVRLGPGEIFGEISFLDSGDAGAGARVVAEDTVECLIVGNDTMEMLATLQPLVGVRFWRSLAVATAFRMRQQYHAVESRR